MGNIKKGMTQTRSQGVEDLMMSYSKAALADLVIDLLRRGVGEEALDGRVLALEFGDAMAPIATVRGDRRHPVDGWTYND